MKPSILLLLCLMLSCNQKDTITKKPITTFSEILEINTLTKSKIVGKDINNIIEQFNLVKKNIYNIDNMSGPSDFEIRIYISWGWGKGKYINYTLLDNKWTAFEKNGGLSTKKIIPEVGWIKFTERLKTLNINNLVTQKEINVTQKSEDSGYYTKVIDGTQCYIEIIEAYNYQFRYYDNIGNEVVSRASFKKLQNTGKILELLIPHFFDNDRKTFKRSKKNILQ
jgi:hypothetical protein